MKKLSEKKKVDHVKITSETVRIRCIELEGFKNVGYGIVKMPSMKAGKSSFEQSEILGIYGQNGSGKTAVINAMELIQRLFTGRSLSESVKDYLRKESPFCRIKVGFSIETEGSYLMVDYTVKLRRNGDSFDIYEENIESSGTTGDESNRKTSLLHYKADVKQVLSPKYRYDELIKDNDDKEIDFAVAVKLASKEKTSVFFSEEGKALFADLTNPATKPYAKVLLSLHNYAKWNLFVITSRHHAPINLNFILPLSFKIQEETRYVKGEIPIRLDQPSVLSEREYQLGKDIIESVNIVLSNMVPGLSIEVYDYGKQMMDSGEEGHRIELLSVREGVRIPLRCESEGIIKIISILNVLIGVYNSPGMCLVIDELDAGIFEFLLGELMVVMSQGAKGQVIFTSHNLRVLEMIDKSSLVFSTTNPMKRYIPIANIKKNNNLRDVYLRSLTLGGQRESLYAETDRVEIGKAFRKAGRGHQ